MRETLREGGRRLERDHARLLARHPRQRLPLYAQQLAQQERRLRQSILRILERRRATLSQSGRALHAISPLATLERGYAILFGADGKVLRSVQGVEPGNSLLARLADGELGLRVDERKNTKPRRL